MTLRDPLVSLIVPVHNRRDLLVACLESVIQQTMSDFVCLFVDDASEWETIEWLREQSQLERRVSVIRLDRNVGASAARNLGISRATGRYVSFLDSDDRLKHDYFERVLKHFGSHAGLGVVLGVTEKIDEERDSRRVKQPNLGNDPIRKILSLDTPVSIAITIDRAVVSSAFGFDEALPALQERDLLIQLAMSSSIGVCSAARYYAAQHDGPRVSTTGHHVEARTKLLEKYAHLLEADQRALSHQRMHLGIAQCHAEQWASAMTVFRTVLRQPGASWKLRLFAFACSVHPTLTRFMMGAYDRLGAIQHSGSR